MSNQPNIDGNCRPVEGYSGYYVDDQGNVWSQHRRGFFGLRKGGQCKKLKQFKNTGGYLLVRFGKKGKMLKVHHLVLLSFGVERPSINHQVRHLNGVKTDNRLQNLKWGTPKENIDDRDLHGKTSRGEHRPNHKLTEDDVKKIRYEREGITGTDVAKEFGVSDNTISYVRLRRTWKHLP